MFPWFATFAAVSASWNALAMGMALGYTSPALEDLKVDLNLSEFESSLFSSLICVGAMFGSLLGGKVGAKFGRRMSLLVAVFPSTFGWLLIALAHHVAVVCLGRIMVGVTIGVTSFLVPTYIIEVTPPSLRGAYGAMNQLQVTVGILMAYVIGTPYDWRWLAVASIAPALVCSLCMICLPESPPWLIAKKSPRAKAVLQKLRGDDDIEEELSSMISSSKSGQSTSQVRYDQLLDAPYRSPVIISLGGMFFQQFSGVNAAIFFASQIFEYAGAEDPEQSTVIFGIVQVVATAISCMIMDRVGRRSLLLISSFGMAVSAFALGLFFYLKSGGNTHGWLALASLLTYITSFSLGMGPIPWLLMPEVLPVEIRAITGGLATCLNWTGAFVVSLTFKSLKASDLHEYGCFWLYGTICIGAFVFFFLLVPETKGRTLEEIQELFYASQRTPLLADDSETRRTPTREIQDLA